MIDYWRQLDFVSPSDLDLEVSLIGLGGLGSPIALALVKMGCPRLTVYDADRVEPHNLPNQLYRLVDVERPKADALGAFLREFAPADIRVVNEMVVDRSFSGIVISAVDSMAARRSIWENCIRYRASVALYVDARMGGEVGRVLTVSPVNPRSVEAYEAALFSDAEGVEDPCTAQATIYGTFGVAAFVANQVKRFVRGEPLFFDHIIDFSTSTLLTDGLV
jgi:molybdopterin/thiamine biosynthesis adenylyltransferase